MLRYVDNPKFAQEWIECYTSIRKFYTNKIYILDSGSVPSMITNIPLENCEVINNYLPNARLFTPFYFLLKSGIAYNNAVIIHDSVIFQRHYDFSDTKDVRFLWHFDTHEYDNYNITHVMTRHLNNNCSILDHYSRKNWKGCLGCMTVITYDFLNKLEVDYKLTELSVCINNKEYAIEFERLLASICYMNSNTLSHNPSYFGEISNNFWGLTLSEYKRRQHEFKDLPVVKLFCAR
jgi:hypothetical protein